MKKITSELIILQQLQDELNNCNVKNFGNVDIYFQETITTTKKTNLRGAQITDKQTKEEGWVVSADWENYEYYRNEKLCDVIFSATVTSLIVKAEKAIKKLTGKDIKLKLVKRE